MKVLLLAATLIAFAPRPAAAGAVACGPGGVVTSPNNCSTGVQSFGIGRTDAWVRTLEAGPLRFDALATAAAWVVGGPPPCCGFGPVAASSSLTFNLITQGVVRQGIIDLFLMSSEEWSGFGGGGAGAGGGVGQYGAPPHWQPPLQGRFPFTLGEPFTVGLSASATAGPTSSSSSGVLVRFQLYEADGVTPVAIDEIPEPGGLAAGGLLALACLRLLQRKRALSRGRGGDRLQERDPD